MGNWELGNGALVIGNWELGIGNDNSQPSTVNSQLISIPAAPE
ncbi:hypothetical protein QUA13_08230 [Microcoleus sp. S28C3]